MSHGLGSFWRRVVRFLAVVIAILFGTGLALYGLVAAWSSGTPPPVIDETGQAIPGSLSEKIFVEINGIPQGMIIQSRDMSNPVLLFVHGGPAMPEFFLNDRYPSGLEQLFTVCWWEQRGAGLSYRPETHDQHLTIGQLVDDGVAVAQYLRTRFGRDKVYLMGHSNGSLIGIQMAARAPEIFQAYIGIAQVTHQLSSEQGSFRMMVDESRRRDDVGLADRLEAAGYPEEVPLPEPYMALRDEAMHTLGGGTTRDMRSVVTGIFVPVWRHRTYTVTEKLNLWRGKWSPTSRRLWNEMLSTDLFAAGLQLRIPVYLLHGQYDLTVSYRLARQFADTLSAPVKGFYTFARSAHSPIFEEPERTRSVLRNDVLSGTTSLSDDPATMRHQGMPPVN